MLTVTGACKPALQASHRDAIADQHTPANTSQAAPIGGEFLVRPAAHITDQIPQFSNLSVIGLYGSLS
jgi:hypothetical protein